MRSLKIAHLIAAMILGYMASSFLRTESTAQPTDEVAVAQAPSRTSAQPSSANRLQGLQSPPESATHGRTSVAVSAHEETLELARLQEEAKLLEDKLVHLGRQVSSTRARIDDVRGTVLSLDPSLEPDHPIAVAFANPALSALHGPATELVVDLISETGLVLSTAESSALANALRDVYAPYIGESGSFEGDLFREDGQVGVAFKRIAETIGRDQLLRRAGRDRLEQWLGPSMFEEVWGDAAVVAQDGGQR